MQGGYYLDDYGLEDDFRDFRPAQDYYVCGSGTVRHNPHAVEGVCHGDDQACDVHDEVMEYTVHNRRNDDWEKAIDTETVPQLLDVDAEERLIDKESVPPLDDALLFAPAAVAAAWNTM